METPIVFLDVDGVLVHQHYENQDTCDIHPIKYVSSNISVIQLMLPWSLSPVGEGGTD